MLQTLDAGNDNTDDENCNTLPRRDGVDNQTQLLSENFGSNVQENTNSKYEEKKRFIENLADFIIVTLIKSDES